MALIFDVIVVPVSGKTGCVRDAHGRIKCFLKSSAEKGKANQELIKMLAKAINCTLTDIAIVQGTTTRKKRIKINVDLSMNELLQRLGLPGEE